MDNTERLSVYKPLKNEPVYYRGAMIGRVARTEGNLCWVDTADGLFIWAFKDGLNAMHDWPSKAGGPVAPCPGYVFEGG